MDIIYRRGRATPVEVQEQMPDPISNAAVRSVLRILEEKGHLRHEQDGPRYVYLPTVPREQARRSALDHLVSTFFDDSAEDAMAALLEMRAEQMSKSEHKRLQEIIQRLRDAEGR